MPVRRSLLREAPGALTVLCSLLLFDFDCYLYEIESKWDSGFLRMASAALEPIETSADEALVLPGQTRETVTRSKLIEVSIVDIGGNDEALQLCGADGKVMKLAAGEDTPGLPLLKENEPSPSPEDTPGPRLSGSRPALSALRRRRMPDGASKAIQGCACTGSGLSPG